MSVNPKNISEIHHRAERFCGTSGFGIVTYRNGGRHGPRVQANYQLVVVHHGGGVVKIDGIANEVVAGEGILLVPGHVEEFQFSQDMETRHSWCQLISEDLPESLRFPISALHRPATCSETTLKLIRMGLKPDSFPARPHAATALVIAAIWSFVAGMEQDVATTNSRLAVPALARFHAAVESLRDEKITLSMLANRAGVSRGHLTKLTHSHMGLTPMEVVWRTRVRKAAKLLGETGLSIAEVADQTGFSNAYHFSRRFKQQFGQAPRDWRSRNRE